jgi:hypothetical protein
MLCAVGNVVPKDWAPMEWSGPVDRAMGPRHAHRACVLMSLLYIFPRGVIGTLCWRVLGFPALPRASTLSPLTLLASFKNWQALGHPV